MAEKIKEIVGYSGGKENQISGLGTFFLIIGIISLIICFIISGNVTKTSSYSDWGEDGLSPLWITISIASLIQGIALFMLLNAGSEIIRLLKKLNGLTYGGKISEPTAETRLKCSNCGNSVSEYDVKCYNCKAGFDSTGKV